MADTEKLIERLAFVADTHPFELEREIVREGIAKLASLTAENERLQRIIDSRPAINAGLPETYIEWSQQIYACDAINAAQVTKQ